MERITTDAQLNKIKEFVQDELTKRGFHAKIKSFEEKTDTRQYIAFETEEFQTVPVIFKSIIVSCFSCGFTKKELGENKKTFDEFYISVNVFYEHFDGRSNGCDLFRVDGVLINDDQVYQMRTY